MTRSAWVCCSITSLTKTRQGSRVARQGSSRRFAAPHSSTRHWKRRTLAAGGGSVPDVVVVRAPARWRVGLLPYHELAPEVADLFASLVEGLRLDGDDAPVVLGLRRGGFEHSRLGVDGVAVKGRRTVQERFNLEIGDARAADVRNAHAEGEGVDEVADNDILALHRLVLGKPRLGMQWVMVHRDHAEEVVVSFG